MKISPRQIASFLKTPNCSVFAILLHGSDAGLRRERYRQLANLYNEDLNDVFSVTHIAGSTLSTESSKIMDSAAEIPLSGKRLVLVKASGTEALEACKVLLSNPQTHAMVIVNAGDTTTKHAIVKLFESSNHAAAIGCYPDTVDEIRILAQTILKKDNITVDPDALELICQRLGSDHEATKSELDKLALLAGPSGHLDFSLVSEALGDSALLTIDQIADAIASGNVSALAVSLQKAWLEDVNCVMVVKGCQTYFSQLRVLSHAIKTGQTAQSAIRSLRPPIHFKHQGAFLTHLKRWQPSHTMAMLYRLQDIEAKIKSKGINDRTLTSQSLLSCCLRSQ